MERSGLTGRGGAGFPTGRKLRSVAAGPGPAVVVANGAEGEPASRKDRLLLSRTPHLVLDGISLAAFAVGADRGLPGRARRRRPAGWRAWRQRRRPGTVAGIDQVPIQVVGIEGRYVASEQTAIVQHLNGGPGLPTFSPPRTHERGVAGRPTAVNNVETLAHLAMIARYGHTWFRETGTPAAPGTTLVTVSGAIARPGVYEIELGTPIGEVLMQAGGPAERPQAVLVGGYFGTWLPARWPGRCPCRIRGSARSAARWARGSWSSCRSHPAGWPRPPAWSGISPAKAPASAVPACSACLPWPTRWPTWPTTAAGATRSTGSPA